MAAKKILVPYNFVKNEIQNAVAHVLASDPSSPTAGQFYYDSTNSLWKYYNGSTFVTDTSRSRHSGTQTASTISDFDTQVRTSRLDQMAAPSASVNLNSQKITNLLDGTSANDAVTFSQLQSVVSNRSWKDAVRVATTTAGTLATSFENGDTIDGVTIVTGNRILIKDQTAGAENGIYVVAASGAPTRATDADLSAEMIPGMSVMVQEGTINADRQFTLTTNAPITLGTTALVFAQTGSGGTYTAGTGIDISGSVISLDTAHARNIDHSAVSITSGAGLTGGGDITATRTLAVGAGTGITVNADDVALDTSSTRNTDHTGVTLSAGAGLTGGGDISASRSFAVGAGTGITVNADDVAIDVTVVARKYTTLIGDNSSTSLAVTHNLSNQWVHAQVFEVATLAQVECDIVLTSSSVTTFIFATAPASNAYRVVIIG